MTSPSFLVVAVLLMILVGATLPVLYQLYQSLKRVRALLDTAGPHFVRTLDQVGHTAERFDWIAERLEGPAQALGPLMQMASKAGHSIGQSEEWPRMPALPGAATTPAKIAASSARLPRGGNHGGNNHYRVDILNKTRDTDHALQQITEQGGTP